jgi:DNA-binding CsgD family transcriptional regulator
LFIVEWLRSGRAHRDKDAGDGLGGPKGQHKRRAGHGGLAGYEFEMIESSGRSLLDNRAAAALMAKLRGAAEHSDPLSGLSDQERVLLDLLGEGLTNKQIAARMFLAEKTVKNYVSRLLTKLGMERRTQAAVFISKLDQSRRRPDG